MGSTYGVVLRVRFLLDRVGPAPITGGTVGAVTLGAPYVITSTLGTVQVIE
jgi:hypothetical protein